MKNYKKLYEAERNLEDRYYRLYKKYLHKYNFWSAISIFLTIITIILFLALISKPSPVYKIYKNECHTQYFALEEIGLCMHKCQIYNPKAFENFSCWDICLKKEEVCNPIEVDKIPSVKYDRDVVYESYIKKSELKKEWLDAFCDCIEGRNCNTQNGITVCASDKCSKYKCRDKYTVEVK